MTPDIEQVYRDRMDALTPIQRMERCAAMFQWTREMLARQIVSEKGPMSAERLRWEVARRQYINEPAVVAMIDRELAHVPT